MAMEGDGRWDVWASNAPVLDAEGKLLYLPRDRQTQVIEAATGKMVAQIPGAGGRGVVLLPEVGRGFVSHYDGVITIFDLKNHEVLGKLKLPENPGSMTYDAASKKIFVCCELTMSVVAFDPGIDPKEGEFTPGIKFEVSPKALVADGKGMLYVTLFEKDEVAVVDTRKMEVATKWSVGAFLRPGGIAMDQERSRLYVGCRGNVTILSAVDGHELASVMVGSGRVGPGMMHFHDGKGYVSAGEGFLAVIGQNAEGKFLMQGKIKVPQGWGFRIDEKMGTIYLPAVDPAVKGKRAGVKVVVIEKQKT
jgi:DNA-binding beta-propeller fold protein YncE